VPSRICIGVSDKDNPFSLFFVGFAPLRFDFWHKQLARFRSTAFAYQELAMLQNIVDGFH